mmetsp:Transcript_29408/g.36338  ORF Transcript_29408/g.36338 Transcript_29408/m.36338 type:complete len:597 (+) Transcript_29408:859-2649(+)
MSSSFNGTETGCLLSQNSASDKVLPVDKPENKRPAWKSQRRRILITLVPVLLGLIIIIILAVVFKKKNKEEYAQSDNTNCGLAEIAGGDDFCSVIGAFPSSEFSFQCLGKSGCTMLVGNSNVSQLQYPILKWSDDEGRMLSNPKYPRCEERIIEAKKSNEKMSLYSIFRQLSFGVSPQVCPFPVGAIALYAGSDMESISFAGAGGIDESKWTSNILEESIFAYEKASTHSDALYRIRTLFSNYYISAELKAEGTVQIVQADDSKQLRLLQLDTGMSDRFTLHGSGWNNMRLEVENSGLYVCLSRNQYKVMDSRTLSEVEFSSTCQFSMRALDDDEAPVIPVRTLPPTSYPTLHPTKFPTPQPTGFPQTGFPTPDPSAFPTEFPTPEPTEYPTPSPAKFPTPEPSPFPTPLPSSFPTLNPSHEPTAPTPQHPFIGGSTLISIASDSVNGGYIHLPDISKEYDFAIKEGHNQFWVRFRSKNRHKYTFTVKSLTSGYDFDMQLCRYPIRDLRTEEPIVPGICDDNGCYVCDFVAPSINDNPHDDSITYTFMYEGYKHIFRVYLKTRVPVEQRKIVKFQIQRRDDGCPSGCGGSGSCSAC